MPLPPAFTEWVFPAGTPVNVAQLQDELHTAAIPFDTLALREGDDGAHVLIAYGPSGESVGFPEEAQAIIEAHVPIPTEREASTTDLEAQYAAAMTRLTDIVTNGPTYTQAQARDALVDLAQIVRRVLRYLKATL